MRFTSILLTTILIFGITYAENDYEQDISGETEQDLNNNFLEYEEQNLSKPPDYTEQNLSNDFVELTENNKPIEVIEAEQKQEAEQEAKEEEEKKEEKQENEDDEKKEEKECWAKKLNYPCCKKDNCMKFYVNDDGAWGFENWKWCGIDTEYCDIKAKECWAEKLGYKCCPDDVCTTLHSDANGEWSIVNDEWCGIISSLCKREFRTAQKPPVKLPLPKPTGWNIKF